MLSRILISAILATIVIVSGCTSMEDRPKETTGMVIGGVLGGVLGSHLSKGHGHGYGHGHYHGHGGGQTVAVILGTLAGAAIGGAIGRSMDDTDRMKTAQVLENVRTGVPSTWQNPDTGNEYRVIPTKTYETAEGPCREYTVDGKVGGKTEQVYGTACRQPDGSWKIQNDR